jgi:DNA transformation protein and related proteins
MDRETIAEMFSAFGPVAAKRMFSGFGLWSEGVCFCLVLRGGEFYLKADPITIPQFEDNGCKPFSYAQRTSGKVVIVNSFWRMPERLYDDPDELADWASPARRRKPEADGVAPAADKSAKPRQKKPIAKAARKPARAAKAVTTTRAPKTGAKRRTTKTKAKAARGKR